MNVQNMKGSSTALPSYHACSRHLLLEERGTHIQLWSLKKSFCPHIIITHRRSRHNIFVIHIGSISASSRKKFINLKEGTDEKISCQTSYQRLQVIYANKVCLLTCCFTGIISLLGAVQILWEHLSDSIKLRWPL